MKKLFLAVAAAVLLSSCAAGKAPENGDFLGRPFETNASAKWGGEDYTLKINRDKTRMSVEITSDNFVTPVSIDYFEGSFTITQGDL